MIGRERNEKEREGMKMSEKENESHFHCLIEHGILLSPLISFPYPVFLSCPLVSSPLLIFLQFKHVIKSVYLNAFSYSAKTY